MKILNNKGAALISSLCALALLMVLSLSMLLSTSVLITQATNKQYEEQCKVSAVTITKELESALFDTSSSLYDYVRNNINTNNWPYYNPDELNHGITADRVLKEFNMTDQYPETTGAINLNMYYEWQVNTDLSEVLLIMEVTCEKGSSKYIVKSTYSLADNSGNWIWSLVERRG